LVLRCHIAGTLISLARFAYVVRRTTRSQDLEGISMDDRHGYYVEDLSPGMSAVFSKTVTEADLLMFAGVSGDTNPLHLDEDFASRTMFESRIAHGMLTASLVSTVLGTRLPGPGAVYVSQSIRFLAPVRIGDTVIARCQIAEVVADKRRVRMTTVCMVGDKKVLDGEAVLMVPARPNGAA
jgi:3-hydroxybutyryl-CoA dehydratase